MLVAMMVNVSKILPEDLLCEGVWCLAHGDFAACKAGTWELHMMLCSAGTAAAAHAGSN